MIKKTTSLDPYLELYDPRGKLLESDDDSAGLYNARIITHLPRSGWYQITATSYNGKHKGSFTLSVTN